MCTKEKNYITTNKQRDESSCAEAYFMNELIERLNFIRNKAEEGKNRLCETDGEKKIFNLLTYSEIYFLWSVMRPVIEKAGDNLNHKKELQKLIKWARIQSMLYEKMFDSFNAGDEQLAQNIVINASEQSETTALS